MQIAASAQFPEILVSDITKTVVKQFRERALGDAPDSTERAGKHGLQSSDLRP